MWFRRLWLPREQWPLCHIVALFQPALSKECCEARSRSLPRRQCSHHPDNVWGPPSATGAAGAALVLVSRCLFSFFAGFFVVLLVVVFPSLFGWWPVHVARDCRNMNDTVMHVACCHPRVLRSKRVARGARAHNVNVTHRTHGGLLSHTKRAGARLQAIGSKLLAGRVEGARCTRHKTYSMQKKKKTASRRPSIHRERAGRVIRTW